MWEFHYAALREIPTTQTLCIIGKDIHMKNISIKGIIIAVLVAITLDIITGYLAVPIFTGSVSIEAFSALANETSVLIYALTTSLLSTILGGYICAQYGKLAPYRNSAIFGMVGVVISIFLATFEPIWFDTIGFITVIPAAMLGGYISVKRNA